MEVSKKVLKVETSNQKAGRSRRLELRLGVRSGDAVMCYLIKQQRHKAKLINYNNLYAITTTQ